MLSSSGLLFGTPTTVGNTTFTVTATDSALNTGSHSYTLEVTGGLTLSPAVLSVGAIGVPYNEILTASGGTAPYTFILSSGPPPTGLTLSSSGVISGTPLVLGTFTFCVTVTDSNTPACTVTQCYTITVAAPAGGPALSAWGIVVLAILLLGAALIVIRHEG
jgi:hypothetical protein